MMPSTATSEKLIVQAVERWEREVRGLRDATGEEPLSDAMKRTALQKIVTPGPLLTSIKKQEFKKDSYE